MESYQKYRLDRNQIKWIALFLMMIDHSACALLTPGTGWYEFLRMGPGRIAYPIFCVLFVEGFFYTKHPWKHIRDLLIAGIVSEVFFDYALTGHIVYWGHQNVMLIWAFSFVLMSIYRYLMNAYDKNECSRLEYDLLSIVTFLLALVFAEYTRLDYGAIGVMCVTLVYYLKYCKAMDEPWQLAMFVGMIDGWGCAKLSPVFAAPIMAVYDPKKPVKQVSVNRRLVRKYWFYAVYPLHLAVLSFLRYIFR